MITLTRMTPFAIYGTSEGFNVKFETTPDQHGRYRCTISDTDETDGEYTEVTPAASLSAALDYALIRIPAIIAARVAGRRPKMQPDAAPAPLVEAIA